MLLAFTLTLFELCSDFCSIALILSLFLQDVIIINKLNKYGVFHITKSIYSLFKYSCFCNILKDLLMPV